MALVWDWNKVLVSYHIRLKGTAIFGLHIGFEPKPKSLFGRRLQHPLTPWPPWLTDPLGPPVPPVPPAQLSTTMYPLTRWGKSSRARVQAFSSVFLVKVGEGNLHWLPIWKKYKKNIYVGETRVVNLGVVPTYPVILTHTIYL